jgi:transposase-like protein
MKKPRRTPEQIVKILREFNALFLEGKTVKQACRELDVKEQTYYAWKKKYGDMGKSDIKRLKQLEDENARLKKLVAELSLDKMILEEFKKGNY